METNEGKLYVLKLNSGAKEMTKASSLNPHLGITRIEDAEKYFAAKYYIGILEKHKEQLNTCSDRDRVRELFYYMNKLTKEYITYSPKEFLSLHHFIVEERL